MASFDTQHLRNVAFLSHAGGGLTTLVESLLFTTGAITRLGKVEAGTTVSDYEQEEVKRRTSIQTSLAPCVWRGTKVNILDTPGYPDFVGEVVSALRAADAALLAVAAQAGVEVGTEEAWSKCEAVGMPRIIFGNKMDRENADFARSLDSIHKAFGKKCAAIQVPVGAQQAFQGVVSLLRLPAAIPPAVAAEVKRLRDLLLEAIADTDDDLATKYLEGEEITPDALTIALKRDILAGKIVPVLAGSASMSLGVNELLDAMVDLLPSPAEAPAVQANAPGGDSPVKLAADSAGPLAALVFKTTADPFVGKLSYFRVFRGTIRSNSHVWNATKGQDERIGQMFVPAGKTQEPTIALMAGDIGAVSKLASTGTCDTLAQRDHAIVLPAIRFPAPIFTAAINPKSKADLDKMATSLARLVEEDPTLHMSRELATSETLLSGMGETHIDVAVEKAKRKFGVELVSSLPKVPYQETISATTKTEYKHRKQSGGHGQYGHVLIELEPMPRGEGFEFQSRVVGGNVPKEYIPAVEKGIVKVLPEGPLAGYPVMDLKVVLYDGSSHPVDSSGMAFEIAGASALRKGMMEARPVLPEPIMHLRVTVPDSCTGEVIGDMNSKRARILGMTPEDGMTVVEAYAPQSEVLRYASQVRSMTQGRGRFTMTYDHYEEVPQHLTQRVVDATKKAMGA
ncbi:MAG: elongation factor G [Dehalococcoidia bacterium]|nr:elongation factor G [Dehalococcoidia bacterium]